MSISERKELEKKALREKILDAAKKILEDEGVDKLSVRKIGSMIDYSPSIIYSYFENKDEIIRLIIEEGYGKVLKALEAAIPKDANPVESILLTFRAYIRLVLDMPDYSKNILFFNSGIENDRLRVLKKGISQRNKTFGYLVKQLESGNEMGMLDIEDVELTAQLIWCSIFGLLSRLNIEKDLEKEQEDRLIHKQLQLIEKSIRK